jgi:hypothetical protein
MISTQYKVKGTGGSVIPFSTDLFLESIDDNFIDTLPPSFRWQPGQENLPIIVSSDFLEMYNIFAVGQGLPQISPKTVSSVSIFIECNTPGGVQSFKGNVVALTDRINSILVPKTFMDWSNLKFAGVSTTKSLRIYIKTKDANNPQLLSFLDAKNYRVNKDKTKFGRAKMMLQNIVSALGIFGILVIILALMLFSFYLQLMIAKSKNNLQLLLTLGYSPNWLSKTVARTWIPIYTIVIICAIFLTQVLHYSFVKISFVETHELHAYLNWMVVLVGLLLLVLSIFTNYRMVKRELKKMGS